MRMYKDRREIPPEVYDELGNDAKRIITSYQTTDDPRASLLWSACDELNTLGVARYSRDHIVTICQGGHGRFENLRIILLEENIASPKYRTDEEILQIHKEITCNRYGRIFLRKDETWPEIRIVFRFLIRLRAIEDRMGCGGPI